MPVLPLTFALSQTWKCIVKAQSHIDVRNHDHLRRHKLWKDCDINNRTQGETSVMGYSMRTALFRYTAWVHFDRSLLLPIWDQRLFAEELYDHRSDTLGSLTHFETVNVAKQAEFSEYLVSHRDMLLNFLQTKVVYRNGHKMPHYVNATLLRRGARGDGSKRHHAGGGGGGNRRRLSQIVDPFASMLQVDPPEHAVVKEGWWD